MTPRETVHPGFDAKRARRVDPSWARERGFAPNEFFSDGRTVFLVVKQSRAHGDWALNQASLSYLADRAAAGAVDGFVVLVDSDYEPVIIMGVDDVAERLADAAPREGRYGPYFWIDADGDSADSVNSYAPAF